MSVIALFSTQLHPVVEMGALTKGHHAYAFHFGSVLSYLYLSDIWVCKATKQAFLVWTKNLLK